ncbi:serine hydrolase [Apiospora hydei]|uniref:Serine hydrolase n=1 Tax=Apiospora hydei TaxID=1337664 RepID=A0ABR1VT07_9PEZI
MGIRRRPSLPPPPKRDLKILMLHGYTQSGALFKGRTGALNKVLNRALGEMPYNYNVEMVYPTGPYNLRPSDIPGYEPPEGAEEDDGKPTDNWGWFQHDEGTGAYRGFDNGMQTIADAIRDAGGVDGVMGFSQGAAFAAMVASAMEAGRTLPSDEKLSNWATQLRSANSNKPLKFCVVYSGFVGRDPDLQWLYEGGFATPSPARVRRARHGGERGPDAGAVGKVHAYRKGGKAQVLVHPGGHFVPVKKEWTTPVAGWLMEVLKGRRCSRRRRRLRKEAL